MRGSGEKSPKLTPAEAKIARRLKDRLRKKPDHKKRAKIEARIARIEERARARAHAQVPTPTHNARDGATGAEYRTYAAGQGRQLPQALQEAAKALRNADKADNRTAEKWAKRWRAVATCRKLRRKLDGTDATAVDTSVLRSREPMAWLPVGPTPPIPDEMPVERAREYVKWRVLALVKPGWQYRYALWRAELTHFKWRLTRYARQPKAWISYASWWHEAKRAAEAFKGRLTTEERREIADQIAELRTRIPKPVDEREVYKILRRADPLYQKKPASDEEARRNEIELLQGRTGDDEDGITNTGFRLATPAADDFELRKESLMVQRLGPSSNLRIRTSKGKWRLASREERATLQAAATGAPVLDKELTTAWERWLTDHGKNWRQSEKEDILAPNLEEAHRLRLQSMARLSAARLSRNVPKKKSTVRRLVLKRVTAFAAQLKATAKRRGPEFFKRAFKPSDQSFSKTNAPRTGNSGQAAAHDWLRRHYREAFQMEELLTRLKEKGNAMREMDERARARGEEKKRRAAA